jgi:hypothetical protein
MGQTPPDLNTQARRKDKRLGAPIWTGGVAFVAAGVLWVVGAPWWLVAAAYAAVVACIAWGYLLTRY